jgi:pimeloyl-ACP methyl ester carboxylesterase
MVEERVQVSGLSTADPAVVWAVAGDFCAAWHPAIAEIWAERDGRGALIRAFTAKGEDTLYRERLTYRSDSDRVLVYTHLEGIVGVESYVARLEVLAEKGGGSRIEWSARLTASDKRASAIAAGTRAIFEMGIAVLARVDEHSAPIPKDRAVAGEAIPPSVLPDISPSRGEIRWGTASPPSNVEYSASDAGSGQRKGVSRISPLEGEMPGRAEGGTRNLSSATVSILIDGNPPLALTVASPEPGPLILFLHGIGGSRMNWLPQLAAVAPSAHAAALDLRGYGESTLGSSQSTVDDYCADILRIMETLGAGRLILCGLSYGSWIATSFAMRHPDRLAGLVLSGGCTGMSEAGVEERDAFRQAREVPLNQGKTPADFAPAVVNVLAGPDAGDDVRQQLLDSMAAIPAATYRDALNCFTRPSERFDFSKLTMPVLMMTGEHDRLAPPAEIRGIANRIAETAPNAYVRFEIIAAAGHVCNVERPDAYNAVLTEFLSEVIP